MSIGDLSAGVAAVRIAAERLRRHRRALRACRDDRDLHGRPRRMAKRSPAKRCGASHPASMRQTTSSTATASAKIRSRFESASPSPREAHRRLHRNGAADQRADQLRPRRPHVRLQDGLQGDHRARTRLRTKGSSLHLTSLLQMARSSPASVPRRPAGTSKPRRSRPS